MPKCFRIEAVSRSRKCEEIGKECRNLIVPRIFRSQLRPPGNSIGRQSHDGQAPCKLFAFLSLLISSQDVKEFVPWSLDLRTVRIDFDDEIKI